MVRLAYRNSTAYSMVSQGQRKFFNYFIYMYVCFVCTCVHAPCLGLEPEAGIHLLEIEVQKVVNHHVDVES